MYALAAVHNFMKAAGQPLEEDPAYHAALEDDSDSDGEEEEGDGVGDGGEVDPHVAWRDAVAQAMWEDY